jgi:hypothetical protein
MLKLKKFFILLIARDYFLAKMRSTVRSSDHRSEPGEMSFHT